MVVGDVATRALSAGEAMCSTGPAGVVSTARSNAPVTSLANRVYGSAA